MKCFCQKRAALLLLSLAVMIIASFSPFATSTLQAQTANPLASDSTKSVLQYLRDLKGKSTNRVLIGQDLGHGSDTIDGNYQSYVTDVEQATQQGIGLIGGDYGLDSNHQYWVANARFIQHWNRGGLVTISWHFDNPWTGGSSWDTHGWEDLDQLLQQGHPAAANWQAQLDEIAVQLEPLRDAGVPVMFRPFHEPNGGWFWWGKKNFAGHEEAFKRLYRDMFNYLTYEKGLDNLLWVYSAAVTYEQSVANYYPGADFIDIVGIDVYDDAARLRDVDAWGNLYNGGHDHYNDLRVLAAAGNHPMGLTEIGRNHGNAPNDWYDYRQVINALRARPEIVFSHAWHSYGDQYGYELHALADHHYLWESLNDPIVANLDDIDLTEVDNDRVEGIIRIKNAWTGQYLSATSNLPKRYVDTDSDEPYYWSQQWEVEPTGNPNIVRLRCRWKHANYASNFLHATGTASANSSRVRAWPSLNNNNRQKWELERVEGNAYRIRNVYKNRYLNANQSGLVVNYDYNESWYSQRWIIESVE